MCKHWYSRAWRFRKALDFRKKKPSERHLRYMIAKIDPLNIVSVFISRNIDSISSAHESLPGFFAQIPNLKAISWETIRRDNLPIIAKYTHLNELVRFFF